MFLCPECCKKEHISELEQLLMPQSYGRCEGCANTTCCVDVILSKEDINEGIHGKIRSSNRK